MTSVYTMRNKLLFPEVCPVPYIGSDVRVDDTPSEQPIGDGEISGFALWAWPAHRWRSGAFSDMFVVVSGTAVSSTWKFPETRPSATYRLVYVGAFGLVVCVPTRPKHIGYQVKMNTYNHLYIERSMQTFYRSSIHVITSTTFTFILIRSIRPVSKM